MLPKTALREAHHLVSIAPLLGRARRDLLREPRERDRRRRLAPAPTPAERRVISGRSNNSSQNHCAAGGATAVAEQVDLRRHDPGIGRAAQEGMLFEPPVRIGGSKRAVEQRAPARSAPRSAPRRTRRRCGPASSCRRCRRTTPGVPSRARAARGGTPPACVTLTPTSASQIGSAAAPPGTITRSLSTLRLARRDPERRRRGLDDPSQQAAIALEQRAHRGIGGHRARRTPAAPIDSRSARRTDRPCPAAAARRASDRR